MLYLIADRDRTKVKLGYSKDPERRLKQLLTASSEELFLIATYPGTRSQEAEFHKWLSPQRKRAEWFDWNDKIELIITKWKQT